MISYTLSDGAVITAPDSTDLVFWAALRATSRFDSEKPIFEFIEDFKKRLKVSFGEEEATWIEDESDIDNLKRIGFITKVED